LRHVCRNSSASAIRSANRSAACTTRRHRSSVTRSHTRRQQPQPKSRSLRRPALVRAAWSTRRTCRSIRLGAAQTSHSASVTVLTPNRYRSLVPVALEEARVALVVPHRGGRLALLPQGVHGHDPVARRPRTALVTEGRLLDRLGSHPDDAPGALQLVD